MGFFARHRFGASVAILTVCLLAGLAMLPLVGHPPAAGAATLSALAGLRADIDGLREHPVRLTVPTGASNALTSTSRAGGPGAGATGRPAPPPPPTITALAAVLLDLDNGRILFSRDARSPRPIASLTKIVTAMEAVRLMGMNRMVTVPQAITALPWDSTLMGLKPGEMLTVRELLEGLFLNSGNDAAVTLSLAVTTEPAFVADMNGLAWQIGLRSTHFANPVGLDDPNQYASAVDLMTAATYLERTYPALAGIASSLAINIPATATHRAYALHNLNRLLSTYAGATGLKTGWTEAAGGCLIATATRNGHHLLSVLLGAHTVFADMRAVLDFGFAISGPSTGA